MVKLPIKELKCIIDEIQGYDYISRVRYVILLICNELYRSKHEIHIKDTSIFKEYAEFDLGDKKTEKNRPLDGSIYSKH